MRKNLCILARVMYVLCDRIAEDCDGKRKREQIMVLNSRLENTFLFYSLDDKKLLKTFKQENIT